jgi:phenylalanyl-tRNA synthetase beta chain
MKVAVAQVGSTLPGGEKIAQAKLRGQISEGMICSELELGLGTDHQGIMELSSSTKVGMPLCDLFPADTVIDLKTPANRFDLQSVVGLAREVAAMTAAEMNEPAPPALPKASANRLLVDKTAEATRYMLGLVSVHPGSPSPAWMVRRLQSVGVRPLGGVVDVTNYAMIELGQPLHAFDAAKVHPPIAVRDARPGEQLTTLDGMARRLGPEDLVIADKSGPIALAGVMGGASTEVGPQTSEILLEAGVFNAVRVRKAALRHGLRTEASARFERGLPAELPPLGMARAVELLEEHAGGTLVALADVKELGRKSRSISLPLERLNLISGLGISYNEAVGALHKLHIETGDGARTKTISVPKVPWWRPDLTLPEDLVEEIVRVRGYDRLPSTLPSWRPERVNFDRQRARHRLVRDTFFAAGLFEVMTYSFVSADQLRAVGLSADRHLKLKNPLSSEQEYLRGSLLASHLTVLARNRRYGTQVGLYEVSEVFAPAADGKHEESRRLGVMLLRPRDSFRHARGLLDLLARELAVQLVVEPAEVGAFAPGRQGRVRLNGRDLGRIGQVDPAVLNGMKISGEVAAFELELDQLLDASGVKRFEGLTRLPMIERDVTVELPSGVSWADVENALRGHSLKFVSDYYGSEIAEGQKALTFRFTVANPDRTPTEAEASQLEASLLGVLERKFGGKRR